VSSPAHPPHEVPTQDLRTLFGDRALPGVIKGRTGQQSSVTGPYGKGGTQICTGRRWQRWSDMLQVWAEQGQIASSWERPGQPLCSSQEEPGTDPQDQLLLLGPRARLWQTPKPREQDSNQNSESSFINPPPSQRSSVPARCRAAGARPHPALPGEPPSGRQPWSRGCRCPMQKLRRHCTQASCSASFFRHPSFEHRYKNT
jgi:hypothetical protein